MSARGLIRIGLLGIGEGKHPVDRRLHLRQRERPVHRREHLARADMHAVQVQLLAVDDARIDAALARHRADDVDRAARPHRAHRFFQGVGAADLDHMIDAGAVGAFQRSPCPSRASTCS